MSRTWPSSPGEPRGQECWETGGALPQRGKERGTSLRSPALPGTPMPCPIAAQLPPKAFGARTALPWAGAHRTTLEQKDPRAWTQPTISSPLPQPSPRVCMRPVLESGRRKHAFANLPTPAGPTRGDRRGLKARPGGARPAAELAPDTRPTGTLAHVSSTWPATLPLRSESEHGLCGPGGLRRQHGSEEAAADQMCRKEMATCQHSIICGHRNWHFTCFP